MQEPDYHDAGNDFPTDLASHGREPGQIAPAVSGSGMDKTAAIVACHEAGVEDLENRRFNCRWGRAYGYSGRREEAILAARAAESGR